MQKSSDHPANRAAKDRKNAAVRAKRAALKAVAAPVTYHAPFTPPELMTHAPSEPVPCPFCDKLFPGVYGVPGVSLLRADRETLICSDCGTREAIEGGLKMPVWKFLERFDSHAVYESEPIAAKMLAWTGERAPWVPHAARAVRQAMRDDPRGGSLNASTPDDMPVISGYEIAASLAWALAGYLSGKMGRGFMFDDCLLALKKAGV